jgi:X-Pro dipeptidyl-peptidase
MHTLSLSTLMLLALPATFSGLPQDAAPVFEDGQAQVVAAFKDPEGWIREHLYVETEFDCDGDGRMDRVHVDVTRPGQTEGEGLKVPVIYQSSPYYSGVGTVDYMWDPHQELGEFPPYRDSMPEIPYQPERTVISEDHVRDWVPRGFAVVHSESPGTGRSQGCPFPGDAIESLAPKAVIDWLCGRARGFTTVDGDQEVKATWCTGKVGMTGTSYNGTLAVAAATTGVEGLEAIIPVAPVVSYYRYYRSNGLVRHPGGYMGEDIDVLYEFIHSNDPALREACNEEVRDTILVEGADRATGDLNDFWTSRDYLRQLDRWHAATLVSHAFNDWNVMPEHTVGLYLALKERGIPTQAFFHQGGHGGPPPLAQMNRWFSRYLYGIENGVEKDALSWVVRESDRRTSPTAYPDYPHPDAAPVTLHPTAGGPGQGGLTLEAEGGQGTEVLVDDFEVPGAELAAAESSPNRLLYASPELTAPVHLSGTGQVHLRLAASKPAANLSIWLVALPWTNARRITDDVITRAWADPQNAASLTESHALTPGEFVELTIDLQPDDQVVPAGTRIGLMVFSSDHDFTLWPEPGTELTLDLDASRLTLPVVGGVPAWAQAVDGR